MILMILSGFAIGRDMIEDMLSIQRNCRESLGGLPLIRISLKVSRRRLLGIETTNHGGVLQKKLLKRNTAGTISNGVSSEW